MRRETFEKDRKVRFFFEVPGCENSFFCSEHRKFLKMDRGKLGTPQIDPRGSNGAIIFAIRSYGVGHEARKLDILMLTKRGALIGTALLQNLGSLARKQCQLVSMALLGRSGDRF